VAVPPSSGSAWCPLGSDVTSPCSGWQRTGELRGPTSQIPPSVCIQDASLFPMVVAQAVGWDLLSTTTAKAMTKRTQEPLLILGKDAAWFPKVPPSPKSEGHKDVPSHQSSNPKKTIHAVLDLAFTSCPL